MDSDGFPTAVQTQTETVNDANNLRIGRNYSSANFFSGDISEMIFYNTTLTTTQINDNKRYLREKWNTK